MNARLQRLDKFSCIEGRSCARTGPEYWIPPKTWRILPRGKLTLLLLTELQASPAEGRLPTAPELDALYLL
jgi:hypothetical protein